jgi:hypothetical protein
MLARINAQPNGSGHTCQRSPTFAVQPEILKARAALPPDPGTATLRDAARVVTNAADLTSSSAAMAMSAVNP